MTPAFPLSTTHIVVFIAAIAAMIGMPVVAGIIVRRTLAIGWGYFGYGALVFFVSQMLLRIPLLAGLQAVLAPRLQPSSLTALLFGAFLAITAGLFEGVGRYAGYRWLMRNEQKTWAKGIMYGLGHGGFESMVFVAGLAIVQLITLLSLTTDQVAALPPEAQAQLTAQLGQITEMPAWLLLAGVWERLWAIIFHVAMSVVVLQVFRRGSLRWLGYAILLHALIDFIVPTVVPQLRLALIPSLLLSEGIMMLFGSVGLWLIWTLRDQPTAEARLS